MLPKSTTYVLREWDPRAGSSGMNHTSKLKYLNYQAYTNAQEAQDIHNFMRNICRIFENILTLSCAVIY